MVLRWAKLCLVESMEHFAIQLDFRIVHRVLEDLLTITRLNITLYECHGVYAYMSKNIHGIHYLWYLEAS